MFFDAIRGDDVAQYAAEIAIVTFGGVARKALDFFAINRQEVPTMYADGATPMGEALDLSLDLLEARKTEYRNAGVDYYQPMVLMTDGHRQIVLTGRTTNRTGQTKKLTVFPIAIGERHFLS